MYAGRVHFPNQRVSHAEKQKSEWYANCCDYVIEAGINARQEINIEEKFNILGGEIPDKYYKKTLNPYNATNENYTRFPATMRNYDMMKGIIRRYVGEYIKNPHDFIVGANNPEVVFSKNAKLAQEVAALAEQAIASKIQQSYQEFIGQGGKYPLVFASMIISIAPVIILYALFQKKIISNTVAGGLKG